MALYLQYQSEVSPTDRNLLTSQTSPELDARLIGEFNTDNYLGALGIIALNPDNYIGGQWGFSHAALSMLALTDSNNSLVLQWLPSWARTQESLEAYWYSREFAASCAELGLPDAWNPINWSEDRRLDYMAPLLFMEDLL